MGISQARFDSKFSLKDVLGGRFSVLGRQYKDKSILHTAYLKTACLTDTCFLKEKIKLSGYCYYSLIQCHSSGILGVLFITYAEKTLVTNNSLVVTRKVQQDTKHEEQFKEMFVLESLDLLVYSSDTGTILVISKNIPESSLVITSN